MRNSGGWRGEKGALEDGQEVSRGRQMGECSGSEGRCWRVESKSQRDFGCTGPHFGLQSPITRTVEVALMRYSFSRVAWLGFLVSHDLLGGGLLRRNLLQLSHRNWGQ